MIIVLMLISIILIILCLFSDDFSEFVLAPICGLGLKLLIFLILLVYLINCKVIDEKIALYTKQNEEIESKIELVVKQYMEHENKTFKDLKAETSYITLVTLYPELKSDDLIKEEIKLYVENNEKILDLKECKIDEKVYRWWIYFGG